MVIGGGEFHCLTAKGADVGTAVAVLGVRVSVGGGVGVGALVGDGVEVGAEHAAKAKTIAAQIAKTGIRVFTTLLDANILV